MSRTVYSVSAFSREVRNLLESRYSEIWLEGEISNLATPTSGHAYFSLKDANAQVRCAFFKNRRLRNPLALQNGLAVIVHAQVSLYESRGDFQLIVNQMEAAGEGELRRRFEALKRQLDDEGLFDPDLKQVIPQYPANIALVTSQTGAALRDMLTTLHHQYPVVGLRLYPAIVQGSTAPASLVKALQLVQRDDHCDVVVMGRGGGTLEDLWAFNDEEVVRAIHQCRLPIITGIGHQTDLTLSDLAADQYAATPTAAAAAAAPDAKQLGKRLLAIRQRIYRCGLRALERCAQRHDSLSARVRHPALVIKQHTQRLDALHSRLSAAAFTHQRNLKFSLFSSAHRLGACSPLTVIEHARIECNALTRQLRYLGFQLTQKHRNHLQSLANQLTTLSPRETVARGYAIVRDPVTGTVVTDVSQLHQGARVRAEISRGWFEATVSQLEPASTPESSTE